MRLQTLFGAVTIREIGPYCVVRTKDMQELTKRLQNAEMGFSYVHSHILPRIQQQRDQQMLNAQKLRDELKAAQLARDSAE